MFRKPEHAATAKAALVQDIKDQMEKDRPAERSTSSSSLPSSSSSHVVAPPAQESFHMKIKRIRLEKDTQVG